jgi:fucose permease
MVLTVLLVIIYLAFISLGLPDSLLGSAWPSMYPNMGVPISYAGIVSMIIAGGTIVSSLFSDRVIRKFGTGLVTSISVLMTAIALLGFSVSREFYMLCIFAIPLGLGAGSVDTALNNFVALHYKSKHMSWLHCFWGVGAMTGPIIMSYFLERGYVFQTGYRTVAIIQFILVVILFVTLPLWKKTSSVNKAETDKVKFDRPEQEDKVISKKELLRLPGAKYALIAFFCYCSIESTTGLWGSSFAVITHSVQVETAAKWASLFFFGITFGRFLSGFITLKLNNRQMIYWGEALIAVGTIMIMLPFGQGTSLAGFILTGIGCAPVYPSLVHETPVNFGAKYSQSMIGVQMACAYVGSTFMPPLYGVLASQTGYWLMPFFNGSILVLMFIMLRMLNKRVDAGSKLT